MTEPGRVRRVLRRGGVQRAVDEELAYHFARTVEELVAGGATRESAEAEARRRFGDVEHYRTKLERIDRALETKRRCSSTRASATWRRSR